VHFRIHNAKLLSAAAAISLVVAGFVSPPAQAVTDYTIPDSITTHFYEVGVTKVPVASGSPYLTIVGSDEVLSLNWNTDVSITNLREGTSTSLGNLNIPTGSRVVDFQHFAEWRATSTTIPIFVTYSILDEATNCHRLFMHEGTIDRTGGGNNSLGRTWFASPCYPKANDYPLALAHAGGRMALIPRAMRANPNRPEFFLGVGDFHVAKPYNIRMTRAARNTLSTIIRISRPNQYEVWARGLRNPQGLVVGQFDGKRELLGTSHGPRGGDEFYLATQGLDFGWPRRSYGTGYLPGPTPDSPDLEGSKRGFAEPLFNWTPGIGASTMLQIDGPAFRQWWGRVPSRVTPDVIISGMGARKLYRVQMAAGAVRGTEVMDIGARVRSLAQLPNGFIVAGLDAGREFLILRPTAQWSTPAGAFVPVG
jgi:hypothetical protein